MKARRRAAKMDKSDDMRFSFCRLVFRNSPMANYQRQSLTQLFFRAAASPHAKVAKAAKAEGTIGRLAQVGIHHSERSNRDQSGFPWDPGRILGEDFPLTIARFIAKSLTSLERDT